MEKVTGHTNLFRRGATYYFRARVPKDISGTYGQSEEKFSLKTKDHREAIKRVRIESAKIVVKFENHRKELERDKRPAIDTITQEQLQHIYDVYYHHLLDEDDDTRLTSFYRGIQKDIPTPTFNEYKDDINIVSEVIRDDYAQGYPDEFFLGEAEEVLSWDGIGIKIKEDSIAFKQVARKLQEATLRAYESIQKRNKGNIVNTPAEPQKALNEPPLESNTPLLSIVIKEWIKDKSRSDWSGKTIQEHKVCTDAFIGMCGDKPFNEYIKADARAFKETLLKLPANWKRKTVFKGMNIRQAALQSEELGLPPMAAKTAKKTLGFVSSLWVWMQGHYDEVDRNIFEGITIKAVSKKRDERHPFTTEELNIIFSAPTYTGCLSVNKTFIAGNHSLEGTAKHWAPIISLFSGMRLGEVLQLYVSDIKEDNGIHYFDINDEGNDKSVKTGGSSRLLPIHQTIIDAGFLTFVNKRRSEGNTRVFPEVTTGTDGTYSSKFSRYFSRLLLSLDIKHEKNSFHSFRHNFEDACREMDVPKEIMDALQGHVGQDMSARYGAGYSLQKLNEGLQKVRYSGLELRL